MHETIVLTLLNLHLPVTVKLVSFDFFFFFQAEDGIRDAQESRGLGDVYKRQVSTQSTGAFEQTLKATIAEILSQSFVKLASTETAAMLNSKDAAKELAPFGGKAADGFFTFPSTSLNDPKPIKKEPITLERLLPLTK
eukprot:TRINITY_DN4499_c0_g1_i3.p1 TRINITY_DN4499_c0_g1~~TRINITY_DN4499_c0_g1_i3.p1  ORF type:complete len:138 (+),score=57.63 TRINITY_DN4499_c0_g1_i3:68-481(+)